VAAEAIKDRLCLAQAVFFLCFNIRKKEKKEERVTGT
jgi:hypothetical protein